MRSYIDQPAFIHTENDPRMHTGPTYTGFLKLSEGCNRRCAFCIIPKLRGNVRSRTVESLVMKLARWLQRGVRELNLVAQDLTHYGIETRYKDSLSTLLPELCKIEGIDWIRLHYVYPDEFSDELVEIIAREPKIVKYLDMPIQHTNDEVLKSMNRRLTKAKLFDVMGKLRAKIPGIVFRTSMIVGFPGETEEQFEEMCPDLETAQSRLCGRIPLLKEEGTRPPSWMARSTRPPNAVAQRSSSTSSNAKPRPVHEKFVGHTVPVMIEGPSEETELLIQGRMPTQAQEIDGHVLINDLGELVNAGELAPGDLVEVEITEAHTHDLLGRATRMISRARKPLTQAPSSADASAEWRGEKGLNTKLDAEEAAAAEA